MSISAERRRFFLALVCGALIWNIAQGEPLNDASRPPADLEQLKAAALQGASNEKLELAIAYDAGQITPRNAALAAEWYREAAALKSPEAELRLGMFAEIGDGVPQSYDEAREHYERAVALGLAEANLRLGILYLEGWGVTRDPAEAVAHIQRAAEADYRPAQRILSDMYAVGVGIAADRAKALDWATRAARAADPAAEVTIGALLMNRISHEEDRKLAREWYQLSVEQEYTRGMLALASTFMQPGATAADRAIGRGWLKLAAEGGNTAAAFYLAGELLLNPAARDEAAARNWLEQSARDGEREARQVLEIASGGMTLADAFKYVITVPYSSRYMASYNDKLQKDTAAGDAISRPPLLIKMTEPVYPVSMRLTDTDGEVLVDFIVDTTGRVRNPKALTSSHPALSDRAVEAVRAWRFSPGLRNGHPVNTHMQVPVIFRMSDVHPYKKPPTSGEGSPPTPR